MVYHVELRATVSGQDAVHLSGLIAFTNGRDEFDVGFRDYSGPDPVSLALGDMPATWGLVVAIDPTAEDALMGLSHYTDGRYLSTGTNQVFDPIFRRNAVGIPILTASRSPTPGDLTVTVSTVDGVTPDQVKALFDDHGGDKRDQLETAIEGLVATGTLHRLSSDDAPLGDLLRPLQSGGILFGSDGLLIATPDNQGGGTAADDNLVLVPSLAGYAPASGGDADLALRAEGRWQDTIAPRLAAFRPPGWVAPEATFGGDATVYRDLEVTVPPAFMLTPIGTYQREAIDERFAGAANYAPLGIYAEIPRRLVENANGQQVDQPIPVSINPAGLNPEPPIGLTNLEAAEAVRGEHFIDAIRIRVRGVAGYTQDGVRRIEAVAQEIVETTGLRVDVIAGSSPIDVRVAVPGLGIMTERWTTLGTAAQIVSGAQGLSGGLLAATLGVVIAYLVAFGMFLTGDQATELGILRQLGWRRPSVVGLVAAQAVALGLLAMVMAVIIVIALSSIAQRHIDGWSIFATAAAILVAHPVAAAFASFPRPGHRRHIAISKPRRSGAPAGFLGLAITLLAEAPGRSIMAAIATALALTVAGLVAAIEIAAGGELRATLFGAVVAVRLAPYHLLAAAAALFGAGALILDGALLTVERRLPLIGTLRAVGWRSGAIRMLVTLEIGLPAMFASLVAAAAVGAAGLGLGLGAITAFLMIGLVGLAATLILAATFLPARAAVNTPPAATLRAEGASGTISGFAPRQALITVATLVVTVSVVAVGWTAAEGAANRPLPFVTPTDHPLSPTAIQISEDVVALTREPDRVPGSASFEHDLTYIDTSLAAAGYGVELHAYLSPQPEYLNAGGQVIPLPATPRPAIAYDAAAWDGQDLEGRTTLIEATSGRLPAICPSGIAILQVKDVSEIPLAQELQRRCLGETAAVIAVRNPANSAWGQVAASIVSVRVPAAHLLTATSPARNGDSEVPWLIASLDSTGPGASQSASPIAVILAVARQAATLGRAVSIGIVGTTDEAAGSVLLQELSTEHLGPMVWLGPMGGPVAPVLGTASIASFDRMAATAGLLWISPIDSSFDGWAIRATNPVGRPTSGGLLEVLSSATSIAPSDETDLNALPLAVGLDAAWLGEPLVPTVGPTSIAGTRTDTANEIHPRDLEQLASSLVAALGDLDR